MKQKIFTFLLFYLFFYSFSGQAQTFTAGNLAVLRTGDGATALATTTTAPLTLVEYSPAGVASATNLSLSAGAAGSRISITGHGSGSHEGQLNLSVDGRFLSLIGYDLSTGTAISGSTPATATASASDKIIVRMGADGTIDYSTKILATHLSTLSNARAAVSNDGSAFWVAGSNTTRYVPFGTTASTVALNSSGYRSISIFNGSLYGMQAFNVPLKFSGLPVAAASTTPVPFDNTYFCSTTACPPSGISKSSTPFLFLDVDKNASTGDPLGFDVFYASNLFGNDLFKYTYVSGTWTSSGPYSAGGIIIALTAKVNASSEVEIYAVRGNGVNNNIAKIIDASGINGNISLSANALTVTQLATAGANYSFRGIAFSPSGSISSTGTLSALTSTYGTASSSGTFNVSGSGLSNGISVTPPTGFEVSLDNTTFAGTVTVTGSGTIASTPVYVRLNSSNALGSYSGNIVLSSSGATSVNVATAASSVTTGALTITASNKNKTYGTAISGAAGSTDFTASGLAGSETIGSVTVAYGTGSATTAAVSTYTGSITASAATGGTFNPNNYTITYGAGDVLVTKAPLTLTADNKSKTYGTVLSTATGATTFTSSGLANAETIGTVTLNYGTGSSATSAVGTYTGSVTPSAATGGTFSANNYTVTYNSGNIVVNPAALTITADNVIKPSGQTLTSGTGKTAFTASGLYATETVGSVTLTYGAGSAAADPVNTYTGTVVPTAATAGTFTASNYTITYVAGNINVVSSVSSFITVTGTLSPFSTSYGTASNAGTLNVSGTGMTAGITVTAPTGYQVSTNSASGYAASVTIGSSGTIASTPVYVRLTSTAIPATYNGNVVASSAGAIDVSTAVTGTVSKASLTIQATNATKTYGQALSGGAGSSAFTATGLAASETIGSVTIAYGTGAAATAAAGTYTGSVVASAATGGTFAPANYIITYVTKDIVVNKANLTVNATAVAKTYGQMLTGSAGSTAFTSSGLLNAETMGSVTIAYGTGAAVNAAVGIYTGSVIPSLATGGTFSAGNYNITYTAGNLTVNKAALTITGTNTSKVYGAANPALVPTYTGFAGTDNASSLTTQPTVSTTATAGSVVGTYTTIPAGAVSANYTITYVNGVLTVNKAPLTITAENKTKMFGSANPVLTVNYAGFIGADNEASLTTPPTISTTATTTSAAGVYPITVSGAVSANYNISYVAGSLTVTKSTNANITALTINSGTLSPSFSAGTSAYTASVGPFVESITVSTTLSDPSASVKFNGATSNVVALNPGSNTINVLITAQDETVKKSYTITIYRGAPELVSASNIMTPNGDGVNDVWVIKDIALFPNNEVKVYDRGGRVVFSKRNYSSEFDGTLQGQPLAEGTYFYTIHLDPKLGVIKGYITILRNR